MVWKDFFKTILKIYLVAGLIASFCLSLERYGINGRVLGKWMLVTIVSFSLLRLALEVSQDKPSIDYKTEMTRHTYDKAYDKGIKSYTNSNGIKKNSWVCESCGGINESTSTFCTKCGKYK